MGSASFHALAAGVFGLSGVVLGAYGAHGLAARGASAEQLSSWDTAVKYQMFHALALLMTSVWMRQTATSALSVSGMAWSIGVLLFSGSIYVLVLGGPRWLGPVTPMGGVALMTGWAALLVAAYRS